MAVWSRGRREHPGTSVRRRLILILGRLCLHVHETLSCRRHGSAQHLDALLMFGRRAAEASPQVLTENTRRDVPRPERLSPSRSILSLMPVLRLFLPPLSTVSFPPSRGLCSVCCRTPPAPFLISFRIGHEFIRNTSFRHLSSPRGLEPPSGIMC